MPFADLLGQETARERLRQMAASGRVPQALLLAGPQGVGKTRAAFLLAAALSCSAKNRGEGDSCGGCPTCIQIARRRHPDLLLIEPEKLQIKIEQIRQLQDFISLAPVAGKQRIVIIQNAHLLNPVAANALLKTLEEPKAAVFFVLISHCHELLPATMLSRCLFFPFTVLARTVLVQILSQYEGACDFSAADQAEAAAWAAGSVARALFFLVPENRQWGRGFVEKFASLPQGGIRQALDLAEEASAVEFTSELFFIIRNFLHDAILWAEGVEVEDEVGWQREVVCFACLGRLKLVSLRREVDMIENDLAVNINLKLALEAFFTGIISV
ncbi:MAG: DNA polymerase III subunit delta' [Deltaproteobacteria bacterium]|nr:DNA polymerase III subunit delta' [Deltaproteobacteria bacterium]